MATLKEKLDMRGNTIIKRFLDNENSLLQSNNIFNSQRTYSAQSKKDYNSSIQKDLSRAASLGGSAAYFEMRKILKTTSQNIKNLEDIWEETKKNDVNSGRKPFGRPPTISKYTYSNDYVEEHLSIDGPPSVGPDQRDLLSARDANHNMGQILGTGSIKDIFTTNELYVQAERIARRTAISPLNIFRILTDETRALSSRYQSGFLRPQDPKLRKIPLNDLLNQNILLPDNNQSASDVYTNTYIDNAAKVPGSTRFSRGMMSGIGIKDLEERDNKGQNPIFNFEDDSKYLSETKNTRGFTSNVNVDNGYLKPAVQHSDWKNFQNKAKYEQQVRGSFAGINLNEKSNVEDLESYGFSEKQFFPFLFETQNRGGGNNDKSFKQYCFLQATLNQLQESYNPNWNPKHFFGRTEQSYTYLFTDRSLDIKFVIFANSGRELQNVYERVNWLAQQTYGSYEMDEEANLTRLKSGPIIRMTIGDVFRQLPGYIKNLQFNWDHGGEGGKWELTKGLRMPTSCEVSLSYQIIHQSLPDRDFDFYYGLQGGMNNAKRGSLIPITNSVAETPSETFVDLLSRIG